MIMPHSWRARLALLVPLALLAACHNGPGPAGRVVPVDGFCGQRSAVALFRAPAQRRLAGQPGALVVRLAPADAGLTPPEGPVRVIPVVAKSATGPQPQLLTASAGILRSGPLPAGRYVLEATGTGYQSRRLTVAVRPGVTDTVRFRLAAACVRRS